MFQKILTAAILLRGRNRPWCVWQWTVLAIREREA